MTGTDPAPVKETQSSGPVTELARDMRLFDITMVGVGAMIGAGIFALTGIAAGHAGPALILAFCLNGVLTLMTAMVYAELGSAIPAAGGGYLWVRFGLPGPSAFLAGWMDWLAHAVAGSLYAVIFGTYIVWGLQVIFGLGEAPTGAGGHGGGGTLFGMPAWPFEKGLTLMICIVFLWINYRGSKETGKAGNIITVAKIIVIAIFIGAGLVAMLRASGNVTVAETYIPFMPNGFSGVLVAMGLTFIAFEGYEIIVQAGEEVQNPRRNIPRAVFFSLLIVIPIYILVAIVCIGALRIPEEVIAETGWGASETWRYLAGLGETGVAVAANDFLPWGLGGILLVIGAVLSTMSALNATTFSSTRVSFAMGRDHYLPEGMARISSKTRTPTVALMASGVIIITVALLLDAERVAGATCAMFLLVFAAVNISSITIRRKYGDKLRYGYVVPGYPIVPLVAAVGQVGIAAWLLASQPMTLALTAGWITAGMIVYYLYSRGQEHEFRASAIAFEQPPRTVKDAKYRVLVPVANPETAQPLVDLAARLVAPESGVVVVLNVVSVPEQTPYWSTRRFVEEGRKVVEAATSHATEAGHDVHGLVRLSRDPGRSIVDTIQDRKINALVMGWAGPRRGPRGKVLGTELDTVLHKADADTVVLRGKVPESPERILIPAANPRQAQFAIHVAEALAGSSTWIELLRVLRPDEDEDEVRAELRSGVFGIDDSDSPVRTPVLGLPVDLRLEQSADVVGTIVEAAKASDLVIVGAAGDSWRHRRSFTAIHRSVAANWDGPLVLVKLHTGRAMFAAQQVIDFMTSREPEE
ncbi:MAG: cationic amino acid transporter [Phycisphaerae bacterium]|nr:cationic amino acid transporter [Phycisphaerae bacterium]